MKAREIKESSQKLNPALEDGSVTAVRHQVKY